MSPPSEACLQRVECVLISVHRRSVALKRLACIHVDRAERKRKTVPPRAGEVETTLRSYDNRDDPRVDRIGDLGQPGLDATIRATGVRDECDVVVLLP
jgi:hypothetical protein